MIILTDLVSGITRIDYDLLNWLHDHTIPHSIPFLQFMSSATTYVSIAVTLFILVLSLIQRSSALRRKFFILASVLIIVALTSQGMKSLITRDRPFEKYPGIEKLSEAGGSSFPSGHTMEAFAVATVLSILFRSRWITITVFCWAVVVGYSRMALGVHYPGDVVGGLITGCFIGWIVTRIFSLSGLIKNGNALSG